MQHSSTSKQRLAETKLHSKSLRNQCKTKVQLYQQQQNLPSSQNSIKFLRHTRRRSGTVCAKETGFQLMTQPAPNSQTQSRPRLNLACGQPSKIQLDTAGRKVFFSPLHDHCLDPSLTVDTQPQQRRVVELLNAHVNFVTNILRTSVSFSNCVTDTRQTAAADRSALLHYSDIHIAKGKLPVSKKESGHLLTQSASS